MCVPSNLQETRIALAAGTEERDWLDTRHDDDYSGLLHVYNTYIESTAGFTLKEQTHASQPPST